MFLCSAFVRCAFPTTAGPISKLLCTSKSFTTTSEAVTGKPVIVQYQTNTNIDTCRMARASIGLHSTGTLKPDRNMLVEAVSKMVRSEQGFSKSCGPTCDFRPQGKFMNWGLNFGGCASCWHWNVRFD